MRKLLMIVAAIAIVASACGGDDDDGGAVAPADSPLVAALANQIVEGSDADSPIATQADAECWAGRIVGGIGEDRLTELGVSADSVGEIEDYDFTDSEIETIVGSLSDCVDLQTLMAEQLTEGLGEEAADCVAGELDDDFLTTIMTAAFRDEEPGEDFIAAFIDIAAKCDLPLG